MSKRKREKKKQLREELRAKREKGDGWYIKRGQLVRGNFFHRDKSSEKKNIELDLMNVQGYTQEKQTKTENVSEVNTFMCLTETQHKYL